MRDSTTVTITSKQFAALASIVGRAKGAYMVTNDEIGPVHDFMEAAAAALKTTSQAAKDVSLDDVKKKCWPIAGCSRQKNSPRAATGSSARPPAATTTPYCRSSENTSKRAREHWRVT